MAEAGRKTILTDEMCTQIRGCILAGLTVEETCSSCGMSPNTWNDWRWTNYLGFADKLMTWRQEKKLKIAEENAEELMLQNEDLKVKASMTTFVLSTLGRKDYHTKSETEHSGGINLYKWDNYEDNNNIQAENVDKGTA